jgi:LysR family transcriptional regulator, glycine cleavage system transcriptional activator
MKDLNRVHINGLRAVEAAGRHGSLRGAAEELGVSIGAVSQHVIRCERQLGRRIFDRTGHGIAPTEFGRAFLGQLTPGFQMLDAAVGLAGRDSDTVLTISVAPVFASKWLVPRLASYSRQHPAIQVRLDASVQMVDLNAGDVDLAIRVGDGAWPRVKAELLLSQEVFPVCSPALAAKLRRPRDILTVPIVRDANSTLSWDLWLAPLGMSESDLGDGYSFTDASLALDAAIAGQGALLAWQTLAQDALAAGHLVAPFAKRVATGIAYFLVTSATRREPPKVAGFKAWIKNEIRETERVFRGSPAAASIRAAVAR